VQKDLQRLLRDGGQDALPNQYFAGRVGSKFIIALRDERTILGVECPTCGKVYVPPREYCEKDLTKIDENWVALGNEGTVVNFTVVRYHDRHLPRRAPYILALIQVDGADTPLAHIVECGLEEIGLGMRVKAVYAETEASTVLNIDHFEPI
jgi:uncharacterized OB-fold protein